MRKTRNLIVLVVILGLLAGSYFFLANRPQDDEEIPLNEKVTILNLIKTI